MEGLPPNSPRLDNRSLGRDFTHFYHQEFCICCLSNRHCCEACFSNGNSESITVVEKNYFEDYLQLIFHAVHFLNGMESCVSIQLIPPYAGVYGFQMYDVYLLKTYVSPVVASSVEARGTSRPRQESRIQNSNDSGWSSNRREKTNTWYVCVYIYIYILFIQCAILHGRAKHETCDKEIYHKNIDVWCCMFLMSTICY